MAGRQGKNSSKNKPSSATSADKRIKGNPGHKKPGPKPGK